MGLADVELCEDEDEGDAVGDDVAEVVPRDGAVHVGEVYEEEGGYEVAGSADVLEGGVPLLGEVFSVL